MVVAEVLLEIPRATGAGAATMSLAPGGEMSGRLTTSCTAQVSAPRQFPANSITVHRLRPAQNSLVMKATGLQPNKEENTHPC